jgi:hypothetical protein
VVVAASERRTLSWLIAGDRSGVMARSTAVVFAGAMLWTVGLYLGDILPRTAATLSPPVTERLLLDIEEAGPRRLLAGPLPADMAVPAAVRRAIREAALRIGVDPGYLMAVAAIESSFDPAARAPGTSAAGLYQFTEDTWLRVVKVFGAAHGLGDYAAQIGVTAHGGVSMPSGAARQELMQLRHDPRLAALLAAELARDNRARLEGVLGRGVTPAETYIAHFLGVAQAARMIEAARHSPRMPAVGLLPSAAATNPGVFLSAGAPLSAGAIVARIEAYFRREVPRFAGA